jgi:hypothetical protein
MCEGIVNHSCHVRHVHGGSAETATETNSGALASLCRAAVSRDSGQIGESLPGDPFVIPRKPPTVPGERVPMPKKPLKVPTGDKQRFSLREN